jgi:SAM-dependent methyltransferase
LENSTEERKGWALFSDETYDIDESPVEDWTNVAARTFSILKNRGIKIDSYCSIGCGSGLDAVIAALAWSPNRILLSDVNEKVLPIAQENIMLNTSRAVHIGTVSSDLFDNFSDQTFELIYENLPNLPWKNANTPAGREWATFTRCSRDSSELSKKWLLATHERFLKQAKDYLEPGGRVVCCIGARVPWEYVKSIFEMQGYEPELIYFGIKKQQQPEEVVRGYAKEEEKRDQNEPFIFLDLAVARELMNKLPQEDPIELLKCFESQEFRQQAYLTAIEAQEVLRNRSNGIGHGVYVISAKPVENN